MLTAEKKERILRNVRQFAESVHASAENRQLLADAIGELLEEIEHTEQDKVSNSDLRAILHAIQEGFRRNDVRFEAIDKRFEAMDKRFDAIDRRFELMEKRFELVDKHFQSMEKRFESLEKRLNFLQWLLAFFVSFLALLITYFGYIRHPMTPEMLEKAIVSALEKTQKNR